MTTVFASRSSSGRRSGISSIGISFEPSMRARVNSQGSLTSSRAGSSPRSSRSLSSRGVMPLYPGSPTSKCPFRVRARVDEETARGGIELLHNGKVLRVLEVGPQVVPRPETDEEPVGVSPTPLAEVLANREVHDVRAAVTERSEAQNEVVHFFRRRV